MNSVQYEEFCRYFLSIKLGITADKICTIDIPDSRRPDLPEYKHQNDFYWEIQDDFNLYLNIANAKWRRTHNELPKFHIST